MRLKVREAKRWGQIKQALALDRSSILGSHAVRSRCPVVSCGETRPLHSPNTEILPPSPRRRRGGLRSLRQHSVKDAKQSAFL